MADMNNEVNLNIAFGNRMIYFLIFVVLSFITLGLYPIYYYVTRTDEKIFLLNEIRNELKNKQIK